MSFGTYEALGGSRWAEADVHGDVVGVVGEVGDLVDGHGDIVGGDVGLTGDEGSGLGSQSSGCECEDVEVHFGKN